MENKKIDETIELQEEVLKDEDRREFLDKFGKLTATLPVGMLVLMSPTQSKAQLSGFVFD